MKNTYLFSFDKFVKRLFHLHKQLHISNVIDLNNKIIIIKNYKVQEGLDFHKIIIEYKYTEVFCFQKKCLILTIE